MVVRWGIIGCGDVARKRVASAIQTTDNSQLLAACRRDPEACHAFCDTFDIERRYTSDAELIADADIDAVYIATPVNLHLPQTLAAAAAGKHVLCEKPMAMSVAECEQMIAACHAADVRLGIAYYRRFYPVVDRIAEVMQSGELGRVLAIRAITSTECNFAPGEDGHWRVVADAGGGGALMDVGSHRLNLFLHLGGPISSVKAHCGTVAASYEAEDCASLTMAFASGMQGMLECYFGTAIDYDEFAVIGTAGHAHTNSLNDGELTIRVGQQQRVETWAPAANFNAPLIADFVAAIEQHQPPRVSGEEGLETNAVIQAAYHDAK